MHLLYLHRIIFDKFAEEFSLFLKCSFFVEYFIILEKNVFEKKEEFGKCLHGKKNEIKMFDMFKILPCKTTNNVFYAKQGVFGNNHMKI